MQGLPLTLTAAISAALVDTSPTMTATLAFSFSAMAVLSLMDLSSASASREATASSYRGRTGGRGKGKGVGGARLARRERGTRSRRRAAGWQGGRRAQGRSVWGPRAWFLTASSAFILLTSSLASTIFWRPAWIDTASSRVYDHLRVYSSL